MSADALQAVPRSRTLIEWFLAGAFSALLATSIVVETWLVPAAVARIVGVFPETRYLQPYAIAWSILAASLWQAVLVLALVVERRRRQGRSVRMPTRWMVGLLAAIILIAIIAIAVLTALALTTPAVMIGIIAMAVAAAAAMLAISILGAANSR